MLEEFQVKSSDENVLLLKGYKIFKKVGEGTYAPVYYTEYVGSKDGRPKKLACKVIDVKKAPRDVVKKFLPRELEVLALINHPHIIHIQSIFQRKSTYYIFMTLAEKGDLLDYLLVHGPVHENRARVWFRQLMLAVQYLHEMGIAHRDLKCENCLISANNNLKLADFGFSRFVVDTFGKNLTSSTFCGSLSYVAPEILRGIPYYPKTSDMWSSGVILFAMLNKSMPFDSKNVKELLYQQLNRKWKMRSKVNNIVTNEVKILIRCLLEPNTDLRIREEEVLTSDWMKQDSRLMVMTSDEERCLLRAKEDFDAYWLKKDNFEKIQSSPAEIQAKKMKELKAKKSHDKNWKTSDFVKSYMTMDKSD